MELPGIEIPRVLDRSLRFKNEVQYSDSVARVKEPRDYSRVRSSLPK
jgi:hypothetical protein